MNWAYLAINHFKLVPGFTEDILEHPRSEIGFPLLQSNKVDFLYMYLWQRIFHIVSQLPGVQTKLKRVQMLDISHLWRVLKTHFCPKSDIETV